MPLGQEKWNPSLMLPSQVPTSGFDFLGPQHLETITVVVSSAATATMCERLTMEMLLPPPLDEATNPLNVDSSLRFLLRLRESALVGMLGEGVLDDGVG